MTGCLPFLGMTWIIHCALARWSSSDQSSRRAIGSTSCSSTRTVTIAAVDPRPASQSLSYHPGWFVGLKYGLVMRRPTGFSDLTTCSRREQDLVIWGHEHDCHITPTRRNSSVLVSQPGSSVATSLTEGEALPKHIAILEIHKRRFRLTPQRLACVRPFVFQDIVLTRQAELDPDDPDVSKKLEALLRDKVRCSRYPELCATLYSDDER